MGIVLNYVICWRRKVLCMPPGGNTVVTGLVVLWNSHPVSVGELTQNITEAPGRAATGARTTR